jgi:hypothetical protein
MLLFYDFIRFILFPRSEKQVGAETDLRGWIVIFLKRETGYCKNNGAAGD